MVYVPDHLEDKEVVLPHNHRLPAANIHIGVVGQIGPNSSSSSKMANFPSPQIGRHSPYLKQRRSFGRPSTPRPERWEQINTLPNVCFQAYSLTAHSHWHEFLFAPQHSLFSSDKFCFSKAISDKNVIGRSCSIVSLKDICCAFHNVQRHKYTFISLFSTSHTKDITYTHFVSESCVKTYMPTCITRT